MHAKGWPGISRDDRETREEDEAKGEEEGFLGNTAFRSRTLDRFESRIAARVTAVIETVP